MTPFRRPLVRCLRLLAIVAIGGSVAAQDAPAPVPAAGGPVLAPGRLVEATLVERWSAEEVQRRAGVAFNAHGPAVIENAVDLWRLRLVTTGLDDAPAVVTALAFIPVEPPRGAAPLLVYGSGTTGVAAACAPSRETLLPTPLGHYRELLAAFAGRGLAVILPDYLGFDDPGRPQAYFIAEAEAHVMLDAARAMIELSRGAERVGVLSGDVFVGGYSQGGHAAFAAADRHASYAPDVPLRGAIAFAATTDVTALLATAAYYAPYVLLSYIAEYGDAIDPSQVLAPHFVSTLEHQAVSLCVDRAQQLYPYDGAAAYAPAFHRALQAGEPEQAAPAFARALAANATGLAGHGFPALVIQGGQDIIVRDATQERFVTALCAAGSAVAYRHLPQARHRDTRVAGFEPALDWVWALASGAPAPSSCPP